MKPNLEATLRLTVREANGQRKRIKAVIDTGFDGFLTLSPGLITELRLVSDGQDCATLADGSETTFNVFLAVIIWDRHNRNINVDEMNATPLIGTALLEQFELHAQFRPRGKVTIKPMRRRPRDP